MEINGRSVSGKNADMKMGNFFLTSFFFHLSGSLLKLALKPESKCTDCFFVSYNQCNSAHCFAQACS